MAKPRAKAPADMPVLEEVMGESRENLAKWLKGQILAMEKEHTARIKRIREGLEHPMPYCAGLVRRFAGLGATKTDIARLCGLPVTVIREYYGEDFELGVALFNIPVAANYWRMASSGDDPNASKGWLERRMPAFKPPKLEIKTENVDAPPLVDSTKLSFEERAMLRQMLTLADQREKDAAAVVPAQSEEASE
jgi:hypothetical protein